MSLAEQRRLAILQARQETFEEGSDGGDGGDAVSLDAMFPASMAETRTLCCEGWRAEMQKGGSNAPCGEFSGQRCGNCATE